MERVTGFGRTRFIANILIWIIVVFCSTQGYAREECGGAVECTVEPGVYTIELPERTDPQAAIPAMIYFHGAGGSGPRVMKNKNMVSAFLARGYAVIAPSGLMRPNSRFGPGWSFLPSRPKRRDELAFAKQVLADAATRFSIDRDQVLMSGFSIGSSLVWYMACQEPSVARAYAPVAGSFWRPHPVAADCNGPIKLMHTHGWRDQTVPLEGRPLRNGALYQGDVFHGMEIMREVNGCSGLRVDKFETNSKFWRRWWNRCTKDSALAFLIHPGGHSVPKEWADQALDWFERL